MALVSYSDSEASHSETENGPQLTEKTTVAPPPSNSSKPSTSTTAPGAGFQTLVDRSNPRKIRVALPEIKPEAPADGDDDGPARKKPRTTGGGGAFSGFNSFLPAPKRNAIADAQKKATGGAARKVFSLKTGATPGFDREADAEMRRDQQAQAVLDSSAGDHDEFSIPSAGSLNNNNNNNTEEPATPQVLKEEVKLKGNAMMFKPLSVARSQKKKKPAKVASASSSSSSSSTTTTTAFAPNLEKDAQKLSPSFKDQAAAPSQAPFPAPVVQKPKISLFSLPSATEDEPKTPANSSAPSSTAYEPLVYNTDLEAAPAGPTQPEEQPEASSSSSVSSARSAGPSSSAQPQTLDHIADDLNLSRAQRRQLFGRQPTSSASRVLHFNTDAEYAANQAMAHQTDLAAAQHNPVRAIAPGKHTLQQLVNAASSQKEALEESFAAGKRNKKEAGSRYGW